MLENSAIIIFQLLFAVVLGALLGAEREYKKKEAGLRTYALVSLAAAFFTIMSFESVKLFSGEAVAFDPSRTIGQIVVGVGFLGAGVIIFRQERLEGLTTAAGLWLSSALGVAVGVKMYFPAFFAALLGVGILAGLRMIEEKFLQKGKEGENK